MQRLYKILVAMLRVPSAAAYLIQNVWKDNPLVSSTVKTALIIFSILIAIFSAVLWHLSASMQEELTMATGYDPKQFSAITTAAAMLNTKAALLGALAAILNGVYFWLSTIGSADISSDA